MRYIMLLITLFLASALACSNSCNGSCRSNGTLPTLNYALDKMHLLEDANVQKTFEAYRSKLASLERGLNTDAFKDATFNRELFMKQHYGMQKASAQADLFEAIYKPLSTEQKEQMHRLMAAHQYYVQGLQSACGPKSSCATKGSCCQSPCGGNACGPKACANCAPCRGVHQNCGGKTKKGHGCDKRCP